MIVYNTTFHAHGDIAEKFLVWLRGEFVPRAVADGRLAEPRLTLVLNAEESDGNNYSLQFRVVDIDTLQAWYSEIGDELIVEMSQKFGRQAVGFSTLLQEMEL